MKNTIKITFLGTGTSLGVPIIACECEVCSSSDHRDNRLRSSILVTTKNKNIVIDTGPDFRQQMLRSKITNLDAVIFTHEHKDHVAGLDDIRPFNLHHKKAVRVYAEERVHLALQREYAYIFSETPYPGIPEITMNIIDLDTFYIDDILVVPIRVMHYKLPILGFRIGNFAYLTDIKSLPPEEKKKLTELDTLVVTSLRKEEHISHMNLQESISFIEDIKPQRAYLTHLSHRFGKHGIEEPKLPPNIFIAYDGLSIDISG
jgi:phosphoribosyl 1,2-cyclic phosphate phosphodiesterase